MPPKKQEHEYHKIWNYDKQCEEPQKMGRHSKMTRHMIEKLEKCFSNSFTDDEAVLYCNIDKETLYTYCDKYPAFSIKKEELKKKPNLKAKQNIISGINSGDKIDSKWWLERKAKDEFSIRQETTGKDGKDLVPEEPPTKETLKKLEDMLKG